ncbi:class I SAM-dependent methyltransferase [Aliikangiella sp. IMCC44359]|uniref:class I SAM-dependent methyltransferase n=1 Tax=Aliikangiella sp. IMCC44359 TaxID=3459125 RepID=UPI00403B0792
MFIKIIGFLCDNWPWFRRKFWRYWYDKLAKDIDVSLWTMMNYGVSLPEDYDFPALEEKDMPDKYCLQMYHYVAKIADVKNKRVLEVGSGRGGGARFMAGYLKPEKFCAIDISSNQIEFANKNHNLQNLEYQLGDAENIPYPDNHFDAVINVESCHCYGDLNAFFSEVSRVLKPGGYFLVSDLRHKKDITNFKESIETYPGFKVLEKEDITNKVIQSLSEDHPRKKQLIEQHVPKNQQPVFEGFAGLKGSDIYNMLDKREVVYYRFAIQVN